MRATIPRTRTTSRDIFTAAARCLALTLAAALALSGCATPNGNARTDTADVQRADATPQTQTVQPRPEDAPRAVDDLKLLTSPTALNLDDEPGTDGFAANIYAVREGGHRPVAVESGELQVLLFDGVVRGSAIVDTEPRQIWAFSPDELRGFAQDSAIGVRYGFTLMWDKTEPFEHDEVTVIARYLPEHEQARPVYSAPVTLALRAK